MAYNKGEVLSKKKACMEFYNNRKWPKVSFTTFYQCCRRKLDERDWAEKITPKIRKKQWRSRWGIFYQEMLWYDEQPQPKSAETLFRNRLRQGFAKEEAILTWEEWLETRREKRDRCPELRGRTVTPKKNKVVEEYNRDPDYYRIDITYPKEVAQAFKREYERLISDTDELLYTTEDWLLKLELNVKLEQLKAELNLFLSFNPM